MGRRWETFRQAVRRWRGRIFGADADNVWRTVVGLLALAIAAVGFSIWQWEWLRGGGASFRGGCPVCAAPVGSWAGVAESHPG